MQPRFIVVRSYSSTTSPARTTKPKAEDDEGDEADEADEDDEDEGLD